MEAAQNVDAILELGRIGKEKKRCQLIMMNEIIHFQKEAELELSS